MLGGIQVMLPPVLFWATRVNGTAWEFAGISDGDGGTDITTHRYCSAPPLNPTAGTLAFEMRPICTRTFMSCVRPLMVTPVTPMLGARRRGQ